MSTKILLAIMSPKILPKNEESCALLCLLTILAICLKSPCSSFPHATSKNSSQAHQSFYVWHQISRARHPDLNWTFQNMLRHEFRTIFVSRPIVKAKHFQNPRLGGHDDKTIVGGIVGCLMSPPTLVQDCIVSKIVVDIRPP